MTVTKANADVLDLTDAYAFSGAVTGAGTAGGHEFVSKVTASSSSTLSFTNMVAGYDYLYIFKHVLPATDNTTLSGVLGIAGPTFRTSTYLGFKSSISANTNQNGAETAKIQVHYHTQGNADREALSGELLLLDPVATTKTDWFGFNHCANPDYGKEMGYTQGFYNADESHTSIKFSYASGNIASGDFLQYRRPNA